jgi:hypothetical protein
MDADRDLRRISWRLAFLLVPEEHNLLINLRATPPYRLHQISR